MPLVACHLPTMAACPAARPSDSRPRVFDSCTSLEETSLTVDRKEVRAVRRT